MNRIFKKIFLIFLYISFFVFIFINSNKIYFGPIIEITELKKKELAQGVALIKGTVKNSFNLEINNLEILLEENGNFKKEIILKNDLNLIILESQINNKKIKKIISILYNKEIDKIDKISIK